MIRLTPWFILSCLLVTPLLAQEPEPPVPPEASGTQASETGGDTTTEPPDIQKQAGQVIADTKEKVGELAEQVDDNAKAHEISAGILQPIYLLTERLSFPAVHWIAFALMATGVVSFALQLVLGKLIVLTRAGFSVTEILADALGLTISVLGLVLTTQAAAENSNFTSSPAAVLSASGAGLVVGFIFYLWGQSQELQAVEGRKQRRARKREE